MKKLILILMSFVSFMAHAYDFEVDGIYYDVVSIPDLTCEVTYKDQNYNSYSGDVTIPATVIYNGRTFSVIAVGDSAFRGCRSLTSVSMPQVTSIGRLAFCASSLTSVSMPAVTSIGVEAFRYCSSLTSVSMPAVTEIWNNAFANCESLISINLPSTVYISTGSFRGCTSLVEVILGPGEDELSFNGNSYFTGCPLKRLSVGRPLKYYDNYEVSSVSPFRGKHLDKLTITSAFTDDTFEADTVYSDVESAYVGWSAKVVILGAKTQEITVFPSTAESLTLECATPPSVTSSMFTNGQYMNMPVTVPAGRLAAYQAAEVWKNFWCLQESGVENVLPDSTAGVYRVYNLQGVLVLTTEDAEAVNRLPKGLYIVNGKKMLIK